MSLRTHLACRELGDVDVAIEYLEEASKDVPETTAKLDERTKALGVRLAA